MGTSGGGLIQRPQQAPYSPMRGGSMQNQQAGKRPADNRNPMQQKG